MKLILIESLKGLLYINIMESKKYKGETNCFGICLNQFKTINRNLFWKKLREMEKGVKIIAYVYHQKTNKNKQIKYVANN